VAAKYNGKGHFGYDICTGLMTQPAVSNH